MESEGRNPASHLKNALEYIQNPDKTEECVLGGGINCLPDTTFEQMEETKNIFNRTGKRQGGDKVGWIVRRISELGGYNNVRDSVKADIFGFDITDVGGNIRLFSEVMKRLEISWMEMSFMRSFRGFMMKVLAEILI